MRRGFSHIHVANRVAAGGQEALEVGVRQGQRDGVDVGVKRDACRGTQLSIEGDTDVMVEIVDQSERATPSRARRRDTSSAAPVDPKAELAVADLVGDGPQIGALLCSRMTR